MTAAPQAIQRIYGSVFLLKILASPCLLSPPLLSAAVSSVSSDASIPAFSLTSGSYVSPLKLQSVSFSFFLESFSSVFFLAVVPAAVFLLLLPDAVLLLPEDDD